MTTRILLVLVVTPVLAAIVFELVRFMRAPQLDDDATRIRTRATVLTILCFLMVILFTLFSPMPAAPDVRLATLPAVAGVVGVIAAGSSEQLWRDTRGAARRVASLTIRQEQEPLSDHALMRRYLLGMVVSAALIALGGLTAAPDGRSLERSWSTGAAATGPYPGWTYGVPILVALALLASATWWALRRVDARPVLDVDRPDLDRALRAGSRVRVLRFAATGSVLTATGLAFIAGMALASLAQNLRLGLPDAPAGQAPFDWTQNAGFALIGLALVGGFVALQSVLWRSPSIPQPAVDPNARQTEAAG